MNMGDMIKEYTKLGNKRLDEQYSGTKQAILLIASEKVRDFMRTGDKGLSKDERELLAKLIGNAMFQSFSLGFGVGKVEGLTKKKVYL